MGPTRAARTRDAWCSHADSPGSCRRLSGPAPEAKLVPSTPAVQTANPLSESLAETGVDSVDLVKIDVEGSEESILAGIQDSDWDRFHQFVIEVHDVNGRLNRMSDLLEHHGYRTFLAREDWEMHGLLGIWTLYAIK